MKRFIICFIACTQLSHGEDVTLVTSYESGHVVASPIITLNLGESAKLMFSAGNAGMIYCNIGSKTFQFTSRIEVAAGISGCNPIAIAGPATIQLGLNGDCVATFSITRSGIASPPAAIPQEADTKWDVILESSSDLVNWTPANPGEYSGTEPKYFFRTRMVKKP